MQRASFPGHGLRIALAALVSLAITPAAGADDGLIVSTDPAALAASLVEPVVATPAAVDHATIVATVAETVPLPTSAPLPQAVPAAAVEPIPALEPQPTPIGTPPPPQPADPEPIEAPVAPVTPVAPDPYTTSPEEPAPAAAPQPTAADEPQYQPEAAQYQPSEPALLADQPATAPEESGLSSSSTSNCSTGMSLGEGMPSFGTWNWNENCGVAAPLLTNTDLQSVAQYHTGITRYHSLNVGFSIQLAGPGDNGPLLHADVVVAVGAQPLIATAQTLAEAWTGPAVAAPAPAGTPTPDPGTVPRPDAAKAEPTAPSVVLAPTANTISSRWAPRTATPRPAQLKPDVHRSRSSHRQPTRHPLPPLRGPVIPVSPAGAAPLGGADSGGYPILLLAPFALALVDSARRVVRDAAPPVVRERDKRRKRPG